jgi:hypothetical protein
MTAFPSSWGPWIRHDGQSMPVPAGTIVEVFTEEDPETALDGVICQIGIAGIDLVQSWHWDTQTRCDQQALPIDRYRIMRPLGLETPGTTRTESREVTELCS